MKRQGQTWMLDQVGRLLIAVLGVALLLFFFYKLYELNVNQESENAKAVLTSISAKINALPKNSDTSFAFQGFTENSWFLAGWNGSDRTKPSRCGLDDSMACLCICPETPDGVTCQQEGFCQIIERPSLLVHTLPVSYIVSYATGAPGAVGGRGALHRACITLPSNLFELHVSLTESSAVLYRDLGDVSLSQSNDDFERLSKCPIRLSGETSSPL